MCVPTKSYWISPIFTIMGHSYSYLQFMRWALCQKCPLLQNSSRYVTSPFISVTKFSIGTLILKLSYCILDWYLGILLWHIIKKRLNTYNMAIQVVEFSNTIYKIFNFGLMVSCQKVPKFDFHSQFSTSKIIEIFWFFFHWKIWN